MDSLSLIGSIMKKRNKKSHETSQEHHVLGLGTCSLTLTTNKLIQLKTNYLLFGKVFHPAFMSPAFCKLLILIQPFVKKMKQLLAIRSFSFSVFPCCSSEPLTKYQRRNIGTLMQKILITL